MSDETVKPQKTNGAEERGQRPYASRDKDKDASQAPGGEQRYRSKRRRKVSFLTVNKIETVDYKEVSILRRFINERGKMIPSRQTGNTAKQQRMITRAINRARELALLPFVVQEMGSDRKEYVPRRDRGDRGDRPPREDRGPREVRDAAPAAVEAAPAPVAEAVEAPTVETPAEE